MTNTADASTGMRVIGRDDWGPDLGLAQGGKWHEIVGSRIGATCRSLYKIELDADARTLPLFHGGEAVYYLARGDATVVELLDSGPVRIPLREGAMVHMHAHTDYTIESPNGADLVGGPSPVADPLTANEGPRSSTSRVSVHYRTDDSVMRVPFISNDARLVVWLGVGAVTANLNHVVMEPGERNREHVHAESEDTIHILEGHGTAENITTGERLPFRPGDTIHIEIGYWHAVVADRGERVVSVGGPCPADLDMLRAAGADVASLITKYGRS